MVRSTTDIAIGTPTPGGKNSVDHITDHTYRRYSLGPIVYAGAEEFHWCFLRGALWEILQGAILQSDQAGYWAIWLAALMALPGILRFQTTLLTRLIKVILLLLTTILFVYTQNFWLCWLLHGLVILLLMPQEEMNTLSDKLA
ncbi:MAG: hypothetical protein R2932_20170 [Caldilineaceae bacterium]